MKTLIIIYTDDGDEEEVETKLSLPTIIELAMKKGEYIDI